MERNQFCDGEVLVKPSALKSSTGPYCPIVSTGISVQESVLLRTWESVKSVINVSTGVGSKPNVSTGVKKQLAAVLTVRSPY